MRKMRDAQDAGCARCGGVRVCKMRDSLPPRSQLFHRSYSNKLIINIHTVLYGDVQDAGACACARCGGPGLADDNTPHN